MKTSFAGQPSSIRASDINVIIGSYKQQYGNFMMPQGAKNAAINTIK
jgi:hypothetical protein